ncbi:MAG: methylmalonyl-CoA mutase family protein, partial [Phycisphaerae bacterium]
MVASVPAPAPSSAKPTAGPKPGTLPRELDLIADFPGLKTPTPEAWRALVDKDLAGAPFEKKLITHTYEGVYLKPLYTRAELPIAPSEHSGAAPFTRGASPLGLTQCGWDIRQERSEPSISGVREAMLEDLQFGVTSIILRLDAAGRAGLDPDDAKAGALAASDGCSLSDAADFDDAFDGVYLDMIGV